MIHNSSDNNLTVGGYSFYQKRQHKLQKDELNAIKYVSSKTDSKDAKQIYMLYNTILIKRCSILLLDWNILKITKFFYIIAKKFQNDKIRPIPVDFNTQNSIDNRHEIFKSKGEVHSLKKKASNIKIMLLSLLLPIWY